MSSSSQRKWLRKGMMAVMMMIEWGSKEEEQVPVTHAAMHGRPPKPRPSASASEEPAAPESTSMTHLPHLTTTLAS